MGYTQEEKIKFSEAFKLRTKNFALTILRIYQAKPK